MPKANKERSALRVTPDSFESDRHFYTKVNNATIHPLVANFFRLSPNTIVSRYCHLYPRVERAAVERLLRYEPKHFRWAGTDLFNTTEADGARKMIIIETNSCPSGQKSMPLLSEDFEKGGYQLLMERTLKPFIEKQDLPQGALAVLYDKNVMEASGYACALADAFDEEVLLVEYYDGEENPAVRWDNNRQLEVRHVSDGEAKWIKLRVAFRYVTQKPWRRLPVAGARTLIINPVLCCLAGGRNKLVAAKAYEMFNSKMHGTGLQIRFPETKRDVKLAEVPLWVRSMGGHAVVKVPYSNAGQGVYTITSDAELEEFMEAESNSGYDQYIIQSLVGNYAWSSRTTEGQFFQMGTVPDAKQRIFVCDTRMMIHFDYQKKAFRPLAIYARRAHQPLKEVLEPGDDSWAMLGTNLSVKQGDNEWITETSRLLLMDTRDFNRLGVGTDDLIDALLQTVMAVVAIDELAEQMLSKDGAFDFDLFESLNQDEKLLSEIREAVNAMDAAAGASPAPAE